MTTIYLSYTPQPPLAAFVDKFWLYEGYTPPHARERLLPDGSMELVINLREDVLHIYDRQQPNQSQRFSGSLLCGAHSQFFVIDTASQAAVMGVHFKPGGAYPFLKFPSTELHNLHVSLDTLWGISASELREQLLAAPTPHLKFHLLEQALLALLARSPARHPAVDFALHEFRHVPHLRTITEVTAQIGLSSRRFIQLFTTEVGLTPKLFCRIRRFQEVLSLIGNQQQVDWTDIALSCGYFDQSHFIHDFHAFSGLNPGSYLVQRSEHQNHVPLPSPSHLSP